MASQTVADHLLARLREWGVEPVFGFSGDGINGLLAPCGRLQTLFKDVASDYLQMVTVPEQLPNVLDWALRIAAGRRPCTAVIIPSDVQELEYSPPTHAVARPLGKPTRRRSGPSATSAWRSSTPPTSARQPSCGWARSRAVDGRGCGPLRHCAGGLAGPAGPDRASVHQGLGVQLGSRPRLGDTRPPFHLGGSS